MFACRRENDRIFRVFRIVRTSFWLAQLRKDFFVAYSYKVSFYSQFFYILILLLPIFFLSKTFSMVDSPHLEEYKNNYFLFAILGLSCSTFVISFVGSASRTIREAQSLGYIDMILNSKISSQYFVITSMMYPCCVGFIRVTLFLLSAYVLQPFYLSFESILFLILFGLLLIGPFIGIGLLAASYVLVFKQGDPVVFFVNVVITVFSGTIYPISVLPESLLMISKMIPFTEALDLIRKLVIFDSVEHVEYSNILLLIILALLSLFIGYFVMTKSIQIVKLRGTSGRY